MGMEHLIDQLATLTAKMLVLNLKIMAGTTVATVITSGGRLWG
jgi:hypothetical protein